MMASVVTKLESLKFSGKDEDFVLFSEQFEARMYLLKLRGVLLGTETEEDFLQKDKPNASREHREEARVKAAKVFEDKKYHVWCELVQCLDAKSVLFLPSQKGDGPAAWGKLCERFGSYERPRLQHLIEKLTSHRKESSETVIEYITRAEDLQYNLKQLGKECRNKCSSPFFWKVCRKSTKHL